MSAGPDNGNHRGDDGLTPEQRRKEIVEILACGVLRLMAGGQAASSQGNSITAGLAGTPSAFGNGFRLGEGSPTHWRMNW